MNKLKEFTALMLTLALIAAGAYLPKAVSLFLDRSDTGNASFAPISSLRFEISKNIPSIGKLAILSRLDSSFELRESKAQMTQQEVLDAIHTGVQPYIDAQLMVYSEADVEMRPTLVQAQDDQALQSVVWLVAISGDPADSSLLQMVIDDETGNILMISSACENVNIEASLAGPEALAVLADIYFTGLGIDDYARSEVRDLEYAYTQDNTSAVRYCFYDSTYGEVNVDLYVHEYGFDIEFPGV